MESSSNNNLSSTETIEEGELEDTESERDPHFTVDRTCIPTVSQDEQDKELHDLNIEVYQQEVLEKEILHQVDKAIEIQKQKKAEDLSAKSETKAKKETNIEPIGISKTKKKENELLDFDLVSQGETEKERKIRMGEMTPFGTLISLKTVESNNLGNIEEYLKKQLEINKARKRKAGLPKKEHLIKIKKKIILKKKEFFPKKRKRKEILGTNSSVDDVDLEKTHGKLLSETTCMDASSGSEYIPGSESDSDFELKSKTSRKSSKKAKKDDEYVSSDGEYSDSVHSSKKFKGKKEVDDGDEINYLARLEEWEKHSSREEIETQVRCLGDGFKVPLVIWNKLYNYQRVGVQWLWELNLQRCGGILGDEMGLGKTIQVISFLASLKVSKIISRHGSFKGLGPVLIVCPTTVMHQWVREFHQWWPQFRVALLHDSGTFKGKRQSLIRDIVKNNGILVTSYITCVQQSEDLLRYTWHYMILDEGHKIRNPDSQIASSVKLFRTPHRLILSGSPMQNNLKELWSLFDFIFPGKLGTLPVFMAEFSVPITQGGYANASKVQVATAFKCATVLRDTISPYLLRRVKEDVKSHINLPPKNEQVLFCRLTDEQKESYVNYLNSGRVDDMLSGKFKIFVGLMELRKICNHPHLFTGGPKLFKWDNPDSLPEEERFGYWKKAGKMIVVETLLKMWKKQGHRVLIFTQSRQMLRILEAFVQSQNYEYIKMDGSTNIGSRQPLINKFNDDKKYYIFLATTHVGGLGVNLTGANRVVIYDPDWNPATDVQARERAWRIGQENQVTIYRLVTSGTIEEKIYHRQIFKQFLTNKVLKDPSQRRFFKSNDLYELFTYKDSEGSTETSAIFAGTGYEVSLKDLSHRQKMKKIREKMNLEKSSMKGALDAKNILTKKKIEKMKQLAQDLSRRIATEVTAKNTKTGDSDVKNESTATPVENLEKEPDKEKRKKHKKKKNKDAVFEGEVIPHLKKQAAYRDVVRGTTALDNDDNDYILKKLFSKSGVQSALQHDQIMDPGSADFALVEGEAEKVAKEAVKALKESRKHYSRVFDEPQAKILPKPRFGRKTFGRKPATAEGDDKNAAMSSAELLQRIRQRNGLCPVMSNVPGSPINDHSELLTDMRNFIAFGAKMESKATTQEIVDRFKDRLPAGQTPLFKALLNEICEFHRMPNGEGIWELRSEFRWYGSDDSAFQCFCLPISKINMANYKYPTDSEGVFVGEYQEEKWENALKAPGPPFDPRDYMISPSESCESLNVEKPTETKGGKLKPCQIQINEKYLIDSEKALKKLLFLVKDGLAHKFVDRLKKLIRIFLRGTPCGFRVCDLPLVIEVVEYFSRNRCCVPEYGGFVKCIMSFAKEPPKTDNASRLLHCDAILSDYFTLLGELLATFDDDFFQVLLLNALDVMLVRPGPADPSCVKLSTCFEAVTESHLPCTIASLIETVPLKLYAHYLEAALKMILVSPAAGYKMIQGNMIEFILRRMKLDECESFTQDVVEKSDGMYERYRLLDRCCFILRELLGIIYDHKLEAPVPGKIALWSLKVVFQEEAKKKFQRALETRNSLGLVLVQLVSAFGDKLPFEQTPLLEDMVAMAVATEIKPEVSWVAEMKMGVTKGDYFLKHSMLLSCCLVANSKEAIPILKKCKFLEGLLKLINPKPEVNWLPTQFVNLLIISLRILSEIVPRLPETFIKNKGNKRILQTIKWLMEKSVDEETLLEALKTFAVILANGEKRILEDAKKEKGVSILLDLGFRLSDVASMKLLHQEKLARILLSLERMLINDCELQTHFAKSSVSLSIKLLKRILANSDFDSKWSPSFMLSFGGFLWEAVAWCEKALKLFVESGGIFLILDFIEVTSFPLQILFLGILVDMTDEGETVPHLLTWRGKKGLGIMSLMINIWKEEEYISKVHRTKEGFILDLDAPLMPEEQWYLTHQFPDSHFYSPSIAEMMCSARPKIHAMYQFLMRRYFDRTQIGESSYHLEVTAVTSSQSVYTPLLEHYLALKMGEVWYEVVREVNMGGTLPLVFDGRTICTLIDEKNKLACRIRRMQEEIALIQKLKDGQDEKDCYSLMKSFRLPGALDAINELDYIMRSSFKEFQARKKEKQLREVEQSLEKFAPMTTNKLNFHRTYITKQNFTCLGEKFLIKSEKVGMETEAPKPVSPVRSEESRFSDNARKVF